MRARRRGRVGERILLVWFSVGGCWVWLLMVVVGGLVVVVGEMVLVLVVKRRVELSGRRERERGDEEIELILKKRMHFTTGKKKSRELVLMLTLWTVCC
jgi:hypothetical protein